MVFWYFIALASGTLNILRMQLSPKERYEREAQFKGRVSDLLNVNSDICSKAPLCP